MNEQKKYDDEKRFVLFTNQKTKDTQPDMTGKGQWLQKPYRFACWTKTIAGEEVLSGRITPDGSFTPDGEFELKRNRDKGGETHPDWKGEATIRGERIQLAGWAREGQKGPFISGRLEQEKASEAEVF